MNTTTVCLTCQYQNYWEENGHYESQSAANHAMMTGCTCSANSAQDTAEFVKAVTR
jgi:hypothetical protein